MLEQAISIRNYNSFNYKNIINSIKNAGFKNVFIEWYNDDLDLQQNVLNYVKEQGLNVIFAHLGYQNSNALWKNNVDGDKEVNRYINDINTCKKNNINLVIIHPTVGYQEPESCEIGLNRIKKIIDHAEKNNVKVAFENVEIVEYLEYIIKNIESNNLGICFDIGHCNLFSNGEIDTNLFKNKVFAVHLHDNYSEKDDHNLPFDGMVNWERSLKQLLDMNYNSFIVLESGYNNFYKEMSIDEFYKLAYIRGIKIINMLNEYKTIRKI